MDKIRYSNDAQRQKGIFPVLTHPNESGFLEATLGGTWVDPKIGSLIQGWILETMNRVLDSYNETALLINAVEKSTEYYRSAPANVGVSTTINIPDSYKIPVLDDVEYFTKEELIDEVPKRLYDKICKDFLVTTVEIMDSLVEKIYHHLTPFFPKPKGKKWLKNPWRDDSLRKLLFDYMKIVKNPKERLGFELVLDRYEELRTIRHIFLHGQGKLTEEYLNTFQKMKNRLPKEIREEKGTCFLNTFWYDEERIHLDVFLVVHGIYMAWSLC